MRNHLLIILGWFFIVLAAIGVVLPIMPTTPFLILALAMFSKSSPRFHKMLLDNKWFGPSLRQWEKNKSMACKTKYKAYLLIVISFTVSISLLYQKPPLQLFLAIMAFILILLVKRVKEEPLDN